MQKKKGLSEIVAYVLLIVIAISLSLLVYAWLKGHLPTKTEKCPEDVSLIIEEYSCNTITKEIDLILRNNGLFNIDGMIIKASNTQEGLAGCPLTNEKEGQYFFDEKLGPGKALEPGKSITANFNYENCGSIVKIGIIPLKDVGRERKLCDQAIINQEIKGC
jgi:flagellin-like protein